MKDIKNGFRKRILIHGSIGGLIGLLILHPISMYISNPDEYNLVYFITLQQIFALKHLMMAGYFAILGAVFGVTFAIYIQKLVKIQEKLRLVSITDELTGLLNRRGFFFLAQKSLKMAERMNKKIVLLFADLDKLKWINDTLGHQEGDLAIINTANILKKTFRESDVIARMGGDEFAVLIMESPESKFDIIYKRLYENIKTFNVPSFQLYKLSISTGIVKYNHALHCSIDELLKQADTSMYESKHNNKILSLN